MGFKVFGLRACPFWTPRSSPQYGSRDFFKLNPGSTSTLAMLSLTLLNEEVLQSLSKKMGFLG